MQLPTDLLRLALPGIVGVLAAAVIASADLRHSSGSDGLSQDSENSGSTTALHGVGTGPQVTPAQVTPAATSQPETDEAVRAAVIDLAERLGVDRSAVMVLSVENVTWPNSSLGCPEPGMAYMQVLTPGQRISLEVDGRVYEYHGGRGGAPRYCENPEPPVSDSSDLDGPVLVPEPIILPVAPTKEP